MKKFYLFFVGLFVFTMTTSLQAQEQYKMQSMFVYNFTRMIAWPQAYQSGDFVIAVYGNSPIINEFNEMAASRQVGSQRIVVRQFNSLSDIQRCHILFIGGNQTRNIAQVVAKLKEDRIATLVVSDAPSSLNNGSVVNFVMDGGRQRYELSEGNARAMGLTLGAEMTRLAIAVK